MGGKTHYFVAPAALLLLLPVAAPSAPGDSDIEAPRGIVDCLLPGPMRRIGGNYYQMPQRPARITASECTIRGGDFLLYDRANYETSLKFWITQAERDSGDADAMYYVGEIYEQGIGRDPDYAAAASWYRKAADAGNTTAMISLAHLHKTGKGVPLDLEVAQALYSQAFGSDIPLPLDPTAVKGADQRVETLIAEVDEVRRQKIAVELELQAASEQLANARHALDDALGGSEAHAELIRELRASIAKQESEITAYRTNLQAMQTENAELKILRQQLEEQKIETARLGSLLASAETIVERRQTELANQQEALDSKQEEFDGQLASATLNREALQAMSRELEDYREEIKTLEATLRKAKHERNLFQALASDAATQEDRVATLTARITVLDKLSSSVESESEALRRELAAARNQLDEQIAAALAAEQATGAETAAHDAEIERLRATVRRTEQETNRHRSDIDRLSQQSAELEQLRGNLEREQAQANRLQQLLTESQDRFAESNARLVQINAARAALDEEIADLRAGAAAGDQASQVRLQQRESELCYTPAPGHRGSARCRCRQPCRTRTA
jgi:chromosome segregation ATPase